MYFIPLALYIALCVLVAIRGRWSQLGFLGTFLLSIFLTPVLVFIGLLLLTPSPHELAQRQK